MAETLDTRLSSKVKKGLGWIALERLLIRGITFVRLPILSSLLAPRDFGLMSIVATVLLFVDVLTRTGFDTALVQKDGDIEAYIDVSWSLSLLKGVIQTLLLILCLQPLAGFYGEPILKQLFLIASGAVLLKSLKSIRMVNLTRAIDMQRITVYNLTTDILGTATTILLAYWLRSVWALILGSLATNLYKAIGSFVIAPYRPRFDFDPAKVKELWAYGKWVLLSGIFLTLFRHGDDLFVGKVMGVTALGYYAMAYRLGNLLTTELVDTVRKVLFPAFANLQNDIVRLRRYFLVSYELTAAAGGVFSLGLCLLAEPFVVLIMGDKWRPMIPPLRVLAVWGGFQMLSMSLAPLFRAVGKPDWWTKVQIFKVTVLVLTIYPLTRKWGITGTSIAVLVAAVTEVPIGLRWVRQTLECRWADLVPALWVPGAAIVVTTTAYVLVQQTVHLSALPHLLIFGSLITVIYGLMLLVLDSRAGIGYVALVKKMLTR